MQASRIIPIVDVANRVARMGSEDWCIFVHGDDHVLVKRDEDGIRWHVTLMADRYTYRGKVCTFSRAPLLNELIAAADELIIAAVYNS